MNIDKSNKTLLGKMMNFMLSVPFGDQIAMDYYGGINEFYEADYKKIKGARQHCEQLIDELNPITAKEIKEALPHAFMGRLEYDGKTFSYCAGQFYNIEVPQAVEAVLEYIKHYRKAIINA